MIFSGESSSLKNTKYLSDNRCAVSYRSAIATLNAQCMLNQLRSASILRTNGISTKYTIQRSGEDITIQIPSGYVHIREQENRWNVYVPENRRERALCYSLSFPEALTKLFRISPAAREIISNVLSKPIYILDDILEAEGIGMVPDIAPPPRPAAEDSSEEGTSEQDVLAVEDTVASSRSSQAQGTPTSSVRRSHSPPAADQIHDPPERLSPEIADGRTYYSRDAYQDLLENVIRLASQTNLPHLNSRAIVGNNQFLEGFDPVITFGIRSQGQMNHDTKIGAAGELFVSTVHNRPSNSELNVYNHRYLRYYPLLVFHGLTGPTGRVPSVGSWQYILGIPVWITGLAERPPILPTMTGQAF
jgi:hypothetical protein